jgi:ATP-binding cassette, subfamily B, bacterial
MAAEPGYLRSRWQWVAGFVPYLTRTLVLVRQAAPRLTLGWLIFLILQGLLPALTVYLTRALVNSIVLAIETGGDEAVVRASLLLAVLMGLILAALELLRGLSNWVRTALSEQVRDHIADLIHVQSQTVDLAFYDLPEFFDNLHRASREASYRPVALLESLGALLQNSITLGAMMLVLLPYGWWLPVALLIGTLPALGIVLRNNRLRHAWQRSVTSDERRAWYFDWLLTSREAAAEIRLFGMGDRFRNGYLSLRRRLRAENLALVRREGLAELVAGGIALLTVGATVLAMVWRVLQGLLTLGDLALVYQAFTQGQNLMRTLLQSVGQIYGNSLFLGDLFEFLALEPSVRDPETPIDLDSSGDQPVAIRFQDVTFSYPGSTRTALEGFNLDIPTGKTVAIVGSNGAGKSTFVKLLCRFYDPTAGCVELFGQDLRHLRQMDIRASLSVMFQLPQQFNMTISENIGLGNPNAAVSPAEIAQAAYYAGVDDIIERLPGGYEALLGIWFLDGTDLSQGEWRRISLARTLLRPAPVLVLDEPTSAMDPWAEMEWLRRFRDYARHRTVLIITHRFSTARLADLICVMENGTIVECGSHEELLAMNGRYALSYSEHR